MTFAERLALAQALMDYFTRKDYTRVSFERLQRRDPAFTAWIPVEFDSNDDARSLVNSARRAGFRVSQRNLTVFVKKESPE